MVTLDRLDSNAIREHRGKLLDKAKSIHETAKAEKRDLTDEETKSFDGIMAEYEGLDADLARAVKYEQAEAHLAARRDDVADPPTQPVGQPPAAAPKPAKPRVRISAIDEYPVTLRAFKDEEEAYNVGHWLRAVCLKDRDSLAFCRERGVEMRYRDDMGQIRMDAQTVDDDTRGGYLVPAPLAAAILAVRDNYGVTRRVCRTIPMASETLSIAKRAGGPTVYSPSEGAAITTSEATWSQVSLTTIDRFTLTRVSRKLLRSAIVSIADQVALEIGQAFGEGMDNEFINGDGTATYFGETGLLSALGAAGKNTLPSGDDTWPEIALADFTATAAYLPEKYHNMNTAWICSRAFYAGVIEKLMIAAGGTTTANIAAGGTPSLLGYPIYFTEKMPTTTAVSTTSIVLGDFYNGVIIGERQGIEIALSEHRYFDSDEIGIRGKISYDINVHGGGDGSNADAYVGMVTAAS